MASNGSGTGTGRTWEVPLGTTSSTYSDVEKRSNCQVMINNCVARPSVAGSCQVGLAHAFGLGCPCAMEV